MSLKNDKKYPNLISKKIHIRFSQNEKCEITSKDEIIAATLGAISKVSARNVDFPEPSEITPECQNVLANQLYESLDKTIEEIVTEDENLKESIKDYGILLFSSSAVRLSLGDFQENNIPKKLQKKPQLKRKRHIDGSESEDEESKLRLVAVSADWVIKS